MAYKPPRDGAKRLRDVMASLSVGNIVGAQARLEDLWPMPPFCGQEDRAALSLDAQLRTFFRDKFQCRYCGKKTVFIGALHLLHAKLGERFPYNRSWQRNKTHPAYWEIVASCDHKKPLARGGKVADANNLVTSCYWCNSMKGDWELEELESIGWEMHDPTDPNWDGLVGHFVQAMEVLHVTDRNLLKWYRVCKKVVG